MQRPIVQERDAATVSSSIASLATLLSHRRRDLSARFEASVRARLPTDGVDRCELLDTLPTFLDELILHVFVVELPLIARPSEPV